MVRQLTFKRYIAVSTVLFMLASAGVASAGNGQALKLGQANTATNDTRVAATLAAAEHGFRVTASGTTTGAAGSFVNSASGNGLLAQTDTASKYGSRHRNAATSFGGGAAGLFEGNKNNGVFATTQFGGPPVEGRPVGAAVHGQNLATGGLGVGVHGQHMGAGPGVRGTSANGYGGEFVSNAYRGAYVRGASDRYSLYVDGQTYLAGALSVQTNAYVYGDLIVSGTCQGCTSAHLASNGGAAAIRPGDLVAAAGVKMHPELGPVMVVQAAQTAEDAVIGVAGPAVERRRNAENAHELVGTTGAVAPDGLLRVIVSGLAQVDVDATPAGIGAPLRVGIDGRPSLAPRAPGRTLGTVVGAAPRGRAWVLLRS